MMDGSMGGSPSSSGFAAGDREPGRRKSSPAGAIYRRNAFIDTCMRRLAPYLNGRPAGSVVEVSINEPGAVWIERTDGSRTLQRDPDLTLDWAERFLVALANEHGATFDPIHHPMLAVELPGGHRLEAAMGTSVTSKLALSIRVNREVPVDIDAFGLHPAQRDALIGCVRGGGAVLVSGPMGCGKTTFLNALAAAIPSQARIVLVEDVAEIRLGQPNTVRLLVPRHGEGQVSYGDVIDAVTRLAPDTVVCGEISSRNAFAVFRMLNLGLASFLSSVHANSPLDALEAWQRNYLLDGRGGGDAVVRYLARTLSAIVQLRRRTDPTTGETVREVCEIAWRRDGDLPRLDIPYHRLMVHPLVDDHPSAVSEPDAKGRVAALEQALARLEGQVDALRLFLRGTSG